MEYGNKSSELQNKENDFLRAVFENLYKQKCPITPEGYIIAQPIYQRGYSKLEAMRAYNRVILDGKADHLPFAEQYKQKLEQERKGFKEYLESKGDEYQTLLKLMEE